jgi:tetratricopeptide (TPR) repeat protein
VNGRRLLQRNGWEIAFAAVGVGIIAATLSSYPAFDTSQAPRSRQTLSPSAANRQLESAKSYLTSHAEDINAHVAVAMAYFQKGPDSYVEALNALEKARALGATSDHLFFYAGVMYDALGLPDYAINELTKYLRHHPNDYETTIRLANLHFKIKRYDQAQTLYKDALRAWPKDATAWYNYGLVSKEKGDYTLALECLERVEKIAGHLPAGGTYERGEIARLQGDKEKAMQLYEQELATNPDYLPALEAKESMIRGKGDYKGSRELRKRIAEIKKAQEKAKAVPVPAETIPPPAPPAPAPTAVPNPAPAPAPEPAAPAPAVPAPVVPPSVPASPVSQPEATTPVPTPPVPVNADTTPTPANP